MNSVAGHWTTLSRELPQKLRAEKEKRKWCQDMCQTDENPFKKIGLEFLPIGWLGMTYFYLHERLILYGKCGWIYNRPMDGVRFLNSTNLMRLIWQRFFFSSGFLFNRPFVSDVCVFHLLSFLKEPLNLWENDQKLATTHKFNIL